MDIWPETNWFAIQCKPYRESLAAASAARLNTAVFLPKIQQEQLVCGIQRLVTKPLFAGYFFARFCPLLLLDAVRHACGVLRVVGSNHFPVPLETGIIESIQNRVQPNGLIHLEQRRFRPGDAVTIEQGPFAGWMGQVERETDDGRRVAILLEAIQQTRVLIENRWLAFSP